MKLIPLTRGKFAMVDDEHYEFLSQWKWNAAKGSTANTYYATRGRVKGDPVGTPRMIQMHRVLMDAKKGEKVDHRDLNGLNNQKLSNLRMATVSQNKANGHSYRGSSSRFRGVTWSRFHDRWRSRIMKDGRMIHLGFFKEEWKAALAYDYAALEHFGEFSRLNLPFVC